MILKNSLFSLFIGGVLTACGGGGGTDAVVNTAEGYWSGPTSNGSNVSLAILENGDAWGIYSSGSTIYGALNGTASGNGTVFSASGKNFDFTAGTVGAGSFTGTVAQKSAINATANIGSTVSLTYQADYDKPASLANLAGSYAGSGRTGLHTFTGNLTINASGSFTAADGGCTTSGSLAPRASGKNIFNFSATFVGVCVLPSNTTVNGVAYLDTTVTPNRVLVLGLNSDKSDGVVILGTKQ